MNKHIVLTLTAALAAGAASAQNLVDAVRFGSNDLGGTARYRSMAGAFGALGGDPSCMGDNPAGLAIYRSTSLVSFTPSFNITSTETDGWGKEKKSDNNFSVANFSGIFSFKTPDADNLVNFTLGIGLERRQDSFRKYSMSLQPQRNTLGDYLTSQANNYLHTYGHQAGSLGEDEAWGSAPLLSLLAFENQAVMVDPDDKYSVYNPTEGLKADQNLRVTEKNRHDEYNLSGAFNILDVFYAGATLKITDFNSTIESQFDEFYPDSPDDALYYGNTVETKGSGIGINFGMLWKPIDTWRIGAAIHTPTWMEMKEFFYASVGTEYLNSNNQHEESWSDAQDSWEYNFSTPWEYQFSTAFVLGDRGLLSLEWDMRDFTTMKYSESSNYVIGKDAFREFNQTIENYAQMQHTIKAGFEYRINKQFSARVGYSYVSSPLKEEAMLSQMEEAKTHYMLYSSSNKLNYSTIDDQQYVTAGVGWRGKCWTFDLACVNHFTNEYAKAYPADYIPSQHVSLSSYRYNIDFSLGYRF